MTIEVDSGYVDTITEEADAIMGACAHLEDKVGELRIRFDPSTMDDETRLETLEYIEGLESTVEAIRKHADSIATA